MLYKQKTDSKFSNEFEGIIPKEGEIRLVANKNRECSYYWIGIEKCREAVLSTHGNPEHPKHNLGFLPCKKLVDAHYRCLTEDFYGDTVEEGPKYIKPHANLFFNCVFKDIKPVSECRGYFDGILREIHRQPDCLIKDYYQMK